MKAIYRFHESCGRMGTLDGVFVADEDAVKKLMGKEVYFGEVLGKHSEIVCDMSDDNIKFLTNSHEVVAAVENFGLSSGFNPFNYIEEDE